MKVASAARRYVKASLVVVMILLSFSGRSQTTKPVSPATAVPAEAPEDTLGRTTPRGSVLGFLSAASRPDDETAAKYLNTPLRRKAAADLAHQLFVVLNQRLSARLYQLSNRPEGSLADPQQPNIELLGTIPSAKGDVEILLERIDRGKSGSIWLFSRATLKAIPNLYNEVSAVPVESVLPKFLTETRLGPIPLFQVLALFAGVPLFYLIVSLLSRLLGQLAALVRHKLWGKPASPAPQVLPVPIRLFALAFVIRAALTRVTLPLLGRQFWSTTATIVTTTACVWLFILLNDWSEKLIRKRLARRVKLGTASVVRLGCRVVDLLAIVVGVLFCLYHFGVNPAAALAGLGVGGIAIALAAQKTLENLFGGTSLILDRVMSVGDMVKIGDKQGTVEDVGLRSTRIRTLDRTMVSMPNGYISSVSLENFSVRDKFWFHQSLSLRKETTSSQMRFLIEGTSNLLRQFAPSDPSSVRVNFVRLGAFSLDVEIFAYLKADSWVHFLQIQGDLLLKVMEILQEANIQMAVQPHTVSLSSAVPEGKPEQR
jgi:MscS family membrane protein